MKKAGIIFFLLSIICILCACAPTVVKVEYIASEGGTISGQSTQELELKDKEVVFEEVCAIPDESYYFAGWSDGVSTPARQDTLSKSQTFTAIFKDIYSHNIRYYATEGGYIHGQALQGCDSTFTGTEVMAVANDGYRFVSWSDGNTYPRRTDRCEDNKKITAEFVKVHTIKFTCNSEFGTVSGAFIQNVDDRKEIMTVYAFPNPGYKLSHWSNGSTDESLSFIATESLEIEAFFVREDLSLPIISIDTINGEEIVSKTDYLDCSVTVSNAEECYLLDSEGARIRGRGNTSWWSQAKKPYKLKFDYKVDLFGNGHARDWLLIPNNTDLSLSRNYLAQSIASLFESISSTSSVHFVELYLNDKYCGVYLICEQIEFADNRIEINEADGVDTSYLIELDSRADGHCITLNDKYYAIKEPDTDEGSFTSEHEEFIKNYLTQCLNTLENGSYDEVSKLIDVRSFAEAYIVYELFNCTDVGYASFNMYKESGGKLYCGPVWDFDRSVGIVGNTDGAKPYNALWARKENVWFHSLLRFDEFEKIVGEILVDKEDEIRDKLDSCYTYLYDNRDSFDRNFEKWKILGTFVWPNDDELTALDTWDLQVEYTRDYLTSSLDFLLTAYPIE